MRQPDLFAPAAIIHPASIAAGAVFDYGGRKLLVHRVCGTDARAPVIVVELGTFGSTLAGQYALWSVDAVTRCISGGR